MSISDILNSSMGFETVTVDDKNLEVSLENVEVFENEHEVEVFEQSTALEMANDAVASLESILEKMDALCENGGMDANTAAMAKVATGAAVSAFQGVVVPQPAMEAFEDEGTRLTATMEAIADVKTFLKNMWDGIVKMWTNLRNAVMRWVDKNISNVGRIAKAAGKMAEKAKEVKGSAKEAEVSFKGQGWIDGGDEDSKVKLRTMSDGVVSKCEDLLGSNGIVGAYKTFVNDINSVDAKDTTKTQKQLIETVTSYNESVGKMLGVPSAFLSTNMPTVTKVLNVFFKDKETGEGRFDSKRETSKVDGVPGVLKVSFSDISGTLSIGSPTITENEGDKIKALTSGEGCAAMFTYAGKIAEAVVNGKDATREAGNLDKQAAKAAEKVIAAANSADSSKDKKDATADDFKAILSVMSGAGKDTTNAIFNITKAYSSAARACYTYAKVSMGNLGEAAE